MPNETPDIGILLGHSRLDKLDVSDVSEHGFNESTMRNIEFLLLGSCDAAADKSTNGS